MKKNGAGTLHKLATTVDGLVVSAKELGEMLGFVVEHMATKDDIVEIRKEMATKAELAEVKKEVRETKTAVLALHAQVNGIESELREMRHERLSVRVADLEEKVFGRSRS